MHPPVRGNIFEKMPEGCLGADFYTMLAKTPTDGLAAMGFKTNVRHGGVDFHLPAGTPIYAIETGYIDTVNHELGLIGLISRKYRWDYGHCEYIFTSEKSWVKEGEIIATVGNRDGLGKRPPNFPWHLHLSVREIETYIEPWNVIIKKQPPLEGDPNNELKSPIDPLPILLNGCKAHMIKNNPP